MPVGILPRVELGLNDKSGSRANAADEIDHGLVIGQRLPSPVFGDVTEESMLDLVPLGGAGGEVRHANG